MRYLYRAKLVRVVDGDTVDLDIDLGFYMTTRQRIRLEGIDTPERGQPGFSEATEFVVRWFESSGGNCLIDTYKTGKFGRWLGELWADDPTVDLTQVSLNTLLISAKLATVYGS